ncbi:hypothetical protein EMIT0357P_40020 [Pseudomonas marginalis]
MVYGIIRSHDEHVQEFEKLGVDRGGFIRVVMQESSGEVLGANKFPSVPTSYISAASPPITRARYGS